MYKKMFLISVICLFSSTAVAVDLFTDGFESGDFATGGWATQNSDAAVKERAANTGTYGAESAKVSWIEKAISTAGYETIHVKYYRQTKGFDAGENLYVEWFDGSAWNPLETIEDASYKDGLQDKTCGAAADENANFKIRFRTNSNKVNEYAFIDDVVVSGTSTVVDTDPPTPNPATFASPPAAISETEITMTATTGSDASPPVEYFFDETSGNPGGADRPWSTDPTYTNTGLQANTQYTYTVQMRDSIPNTGTASAPASATTPDNTPPTPDPMTWATAPYSTGTTSIAMVAATATDVSGVEYYFQCTSGGGNDSGWQDSTSYTDTGLAPDTQYCYTVQARDKSPAQNATAASTPPACATTDAVPDTTPPDPDPMTWATPPYSTGTSSLAMVATTATDDSGVEYYFDCTSGGGNDSGWQDSTSYTDTGLTPDTQYCYAVQARDKSPAQNATAASTPPACATTDAVPDTTPPDPDPMTWATAPYSTGTTSIAMVATTATDDSGVEYYFDCTSGGGNDSGWQDSTSYEDTGLSPDTQYCYAVQARDKSPAQNATAFSTPPACATTDAVPDTTPPDPDPMTWATPPYSTGTTSIAMIATTATDDSGVEYYFDCTSGGGNDSGWQDSTSYTDTGLTPDTQYCYAVQARDKSPNQNATAASSPPACATTDSQPAPAAILADVGGCGPLQSGWISLGACGTYTDVGGTGVDVTLATGNPSACACRNPGGTGTLADVEADLLFADNENSTPNADFILTLSNLTNGANYQVLSYHNRSDEGVTTIPNVTVTGAINVTKPSSIVQDHPIMDSPAEILFTAGAGDVVIRYEAPSGGCPGCQVFFNGFELYSLGTTVGFETSASGGLETVTPALLSVVVTNADPVETYTVDYAATGGTATGGGVDYTLTPDTLTFNPGVTQQNVSIDIVDDGGGEPDETIIVTLSNVTGQDAALGLSEHTYTISDGTPSVAFDSASSSGAEDVGTANIAVSLTLSTPDTVTVDYAVTGGTATGGGVDYTLLGSGTLTFDPFATTQNISLDIEDDTEGEENETVILTLSNPVNATLGSVTDHTYTIIDNEEGVVWDGLVWYYSGDSADFFINGDGDLEWSPQGGEQFITRIPDAALSQVGQVVEKSYMWMTDGQHDCADCFACPGGCYDDDITCIAGTSDMRWGMFEADGEWVTSDGFAVTDSSIFTGYKGYNFRFGPNMLAGPTRWVDCTSEVHKTGNFAKKPQSSSNLMYTNDGLMAYIPGFELTPAEYSLFTARLERTSSSSIQMRITLNGRTYTDTDSSSSEQPSKIDVLAVHMRNHRPYSRLVLHSLTGPDNNPPSPDPMTWATTPYGSGSTEITMVATAATDVSGVEYFFDCTAGAGHDSSWQDSTIYVDTGLQPSTSYTYRVKARDKSSNQNETGWSTEETGTTLASDPLKIAPGNITTTCSSVNYQLEGYYSTDESGLTGDLHTNYIGGAPPAPGEGTMWLSNEINGAWVKYEFDQTYTLTTMWVWNYNQDVTGGGDLRTNRGYNQCTIEYSINGSDWTQLGGTQTFAEADGSDTYAHNTEIGFGSVDARYVRLTCISNHGGTSAGLSEVRFYHAGP